MIKGLFIFHSGRYACSNQVELSIVSDRENVKRTNIFTAKKCFGAPLKVDCDVDCVVKYNNGPPLHFTARVLSWQPEGITTLKLTSEMKNEKANLFLSTIAKLN